MAELSPSSQKPRKLRFPLYLQIIVAMGVGLVVGPLLGRGAAGLGEIGRLVIQLIKAAATPLLFLAIIHAILKTEVRGRAALRLFFFAAVNASIAICIGLLISNVLQPGRTLSALATASPAATATYNKKIDLLATLGSYVPSSLVTPFAENLVLPIILLAVLLGFGLRRVRRQQLSTGGQAFRAVEDAVETLLQVMEVMLGWVINLIPFAVFGVVARAVGSTATGRSEAWPPTWPWGSVV